jgi:hypothetical protein
VAPMGARAAAAPLVLRRTYVRYRPSPSQA